MLHQAFIYVGSTVGSTKTAKVATHFISGAISYPITGSDSSWLFKDVLPIE
ncbi:hypothetical protein MKX03_014988 [Papaver bracteatum]|nr:hypothetical protein MKX03_014988 [Papaver bracteatum]